MCCLLHNNNNNAYPSIDVYLNCLYNLKRL